MKTFRSVAEGLGESLAGAVMLRNRSNRARVVFVCCLLCGMAGATALFSQTKQASKNAVTPQATAASAPGQALTDEQMARMSSNELAHYVFEHHGCAGCHTLGANGKLGFTDRGKQVGKGFEGCIALLTSMSSIVQTKENDRNTTQKEKAARFQEFGCTSCHQVTPGKLGLTSYGGKLKSLHMACTDVEKTLSTEKR